VAIDGFYQMWPRGQKFQGLRPLRVAFGKPVSPPDPYGNPEAAVAQMIAEVKARVVAMWEQLRDAMPEDPAERATAATAD
jgi:1-acyl-sn-glycerol-3-phosphate acyltransferase